jgi:hypothetical protein
VAFTGALVDRARRVIDAPTPVRVEGTTRFETVHDAWFKCRFTYSPAPDSDDTQGGVRRTPRNGQFMCGMKDTDGNTLQISSADRLELDSNELGQAIFEVTGDLEPIRKKRKMLGWMGTVVRVEEHDFMRAEP